MIEVVGYNVNSYDILDQPAFLTAEFLRGDQVAACTAGEGLTIYDLKQRVRKVQRYSLQRTFAECYRLRAETQSFYTQARREAREEGLAFMIQPGKRYLRRGMRMPEFERLPVKELVERGSVNYGPVSPKPVFSWERDRLGKTLKGYLPKELEERLSDEGRSMEFLPQKGAALGEELENGYNLYAFPFNATGFPCLEIQCNAPCTVYLMFDETLEEGKLNFLRMGAYNFFKYTLDAGTHRIMTFAPYTMKYIQVAVKGKALLKEVHLVEYKHPPVPRRVKLPKDTVLEEIYRAARESYLSNAVDIFLQGEGRMALRQLLHLQSGACAHGGMPGGAGFPEQLYPGGKIRLSAGGDAAHVLSCGSQRLRIHSQLGHVVCAGTGGVFRAQRGQRAGGPGKAQGHGAGGLFCTL